MKNTAGLIVPVLMMLVGVYVLFVSLGSSGEQVTLIANQALPRGLALALGLIGLGGGVFVFFTALSKRRLTSS